MQTTEKSITESINGYYDDIAMFSNKRSLIDSLGFHNHGLWTKTDNSVEAAQIELIETLVSFFAGNYGNILDVACGKGASTRFLTKYFEQNRITGINVSEKQLEVCKLIAPGCDFRLMDATRIEFTDESFENILCIESALHFKPRTKFFQEAHRTLRCGGRLAMSDVIVHDLDLWPDGPFKGTLPPENSLPSLEAYRQQLLDIGFRYVRVEDTTALSLGAVSRYAVTKAEREKDMESLKYAAHRNIFSQISTWCLAFAIK